MTDVWSERADAYRESEAHRQGRDLELLEEWAAGKTVLDVATGGGHAAARLREAGCQVVTCDSAPGMQPDVICRAEDLPFADASFGVVTCRVAAHHFEDPAAAVQEFARVSSDLVLVADNLYLGDVGEEADRLRDPTHVRNYGVEEWRVLFEQAGLEVADERLLQRPLEIEPWLERAETPAADRERVKELLADRIADGWMDLPTLVLKGTKV